MKKGLTLIELVVAISVVSIIILVEIKLFSQHVQVYKSFIRNNREEVYSREALRFIETEVYDLSNKVIRVYNDKIIFEKNGGDKNTIKVNYKYNGYYRVVISYYKVVSGKTTTNTIIEDIKTFNIQSKKNLIYISIYTINGEKYERCLGSKKVVKVS